MNLGIVIAIFGGLLALALALPGLLLAWALLLPATVERARQRIEARPWRCFWAGLAGGLLAALGLSVLFNLPSGLLQLMAWVGLGLLFAAASLGGAGLAALMAGRLGPGPGALLRSAVVLELAAIVPVVGWFVLFPLLSVVSLGAAGLALIGRRPRPLAELVEVPSGAQPS